MAKPARKRRTEREAAQAVEAQASAAIDKAAAQAKTLRGGGLPRGAVIALVAVVAALAIVGGVFLFTHLQRTGEVSGVVSQMSTEQKIEQLLMPVFDDYGEEGAAEKAPVTELNGAMTDLLSSHSFAGVLLTSNNCSNTEKAARMVASMQAANASSGVPVQLLVGINQEGGSQTSIETGIRMPGNMAVAATFDAQNGRRSGSLLSSELAPLGVNLDIAPVANVEYGGAGSLLGTRSFSSDAQTAGEFTSAYIEGLHDNDVASALAFFPCYGATADAGASGFVEVDASYDELKQSALTPFKQGIGAGAEAVVVGHVQCPQIESETYASSATGKKVTLPASLSHAVISDVLRGSLGFGGVVITDSLSAAAITDNFDAVDAATLAINAGADILVAPFQTDSAQALSQVDDFVAALAARVESGEIDAQTLDAAVTRVLTLKQSQNLLEAYEAGNVEERVQAAVASVGSEEHRAVEWDLTKRTVTLVKNDDNTLPIYRLNEKTVIFVPRDEYVSAAEYGVDLVREAKILIEGAVVSCVSYETSTVDEMIAAAQGANNVVVVTNAASLIELDPTNEAGAPSAKVDALITSVKDAGGRVVLLSGGLPCEVARYTNVDAVMMCWAVGGMSADPRTATEAISFSPNLPAALYMMFGAGMTTARLPVDIPELTSDYKLSDTLLYKRGDGMMFDSNATTPVASKEGSAA